MKVNSAIEKRFRNIQIEYQVAAYIMRVAPMKAAALRTVWFSVVPLRKLVTLLSKLKVTLTKEAALQELKSVIEHGDVEMYEECLNEVMRAKIKSLSVQSIQILIRQLHELYESRKCLYGIVVITKSVKDKTFTLQKTKDQLKALVKDSSPMINDRSGDYLDDFPSRKETVNERSTRTSDVDTGVGIPTGIMRFDQIFGGIMPTEFGIIAGRTEIGKTATLIAFALHAWLLGKSVAFASGEMSKELIEFRMDGNLAGIPIQNFRTGDLKKEEWKRWKDTIEKLKITQESFLEVISFPRNFTARDIEAELLRIEEVKEQKVDLLCIDYINIMNPESGGGGSSKEWTSQADVVWDVKGLAAERSISIWSAGQIIDTAYEVDRLKVEHLKYARAIGETAPIVVGLVQTVDDMLENRMQFQVLKMRNAPPMHNSLYLHPNLEVMRIHERMVKKKDLLMLEDDVAEAEVVKKSYKKRRML